MAKAKTVKRAPALKAVTPPSNIVNSNMLISAGKVLKVSFNPTSKEITVSFIEKTDDTITYSGTTTLTQEV